MLSWLGGGNFMSAARDVALSFAGGATLHRRRYPSNVSWNLP
jgi:hypothetical protein